MWYARVCSNEPLRKNRQFILDFFTEEEKAAFRKDPRSVWEYINKEIASTRISSTVRS